MAVVNQSAPRATVVPILVYEDVAKAIDGYATPSVSGNVYALGFRVAASAMRSSTLVRAPSCWAARAPSFGRRAPTK